MIKIILHVFIVQLLLYSIPAYQAYHSKKKPPKPIHKYISITKKCHNFKEGKMELEVD